MDVKTQQQYAETFHGLHRKGDPLVLFNAWDVATAKAIAKTSPAIATSSGAVASALGYADGEHVPFDMVTGLVSRITAAVPVPVSIDLEAGYGDTPDAAAKSATEILKAGAIGINIEDGLSGESGNSSVPNSMPRRSRRCGTLRKNSEFICSSMREPIRFC